MGVEAFELADAFLGAEIDALRSEELLQDAGEQVAPLAHAEGAELQGEPGAVTVHGEAGQAVTLAVDEATSAVGGHQAELLAQADGGLELFAEEGHVQRGAGPPGVEADAELALAVVEAAGDEIAGV